MQLVLGVILIAIALWLLSSKEMRQPRILWAPILFATMGVEALAPTGDPKWHGLVVAAQAVFVACGLWGLFATRRAIGAPRDPRRFALRIVGLVIVLIGGGVAALAPQQQSSIVWLWCGGLTVVAGAAIWLLARDRIAQA